MLRIHKTALRPRRTAMGPRLPRTFDLKTVREESSEGGLAKEGPTKEESTKEKCHTAPSPASVNTDDTPPRCLLLPMRQDMDVTHFHTGESRNPDVDSTSSEHAFGSDFVPLTSTDSGPSTSTTIPTLPDVEFDLIFALAVLHSMGRVSKRDYRHRHQTQEFFAYQPTSDQETSDGQDKSTTTPANAQQRLATGEVEKCPVGKECPECIAGRSTPVGTDGSTSLPVAGTSSSGSTTNKPGKISVEKIGMKVSDLFHGLMLMKKPPTELATKSQTSMKSEPGVYLNHWEIFESLTDAFRREAAADTIQHLCKKLDMYNFENQNLEAKGAAGLPFLNEGELIDMINGAKMTPEPLPKPVQLTLLQTTIITPPNDLTISPANEKLNDGFTPADQECIARGKLWANLLIKENRRMRAKWRSEYETEMRDGPSKGIAPAENAADMNKIYDAILAEDQVKAHARIDAALDDCIEFATHKRSLHEQSTYWQQYPELLANPHFLQNAKKSLKEWCTRNYIQSLAEDGASTEKYRVLVSKGDVLPKHAWGSTPPPVWDFEASDWVWKESSTIDKDKHTIAPEPRSKDKGEASKTVIKPKLTSQAAQSASNDKAEDTKAVIAPKAIIQGTHEGEENPATLTKNQKRAKARREKRKAKKEAVNTDDDVDAVSSIGAQPTTPETPDLTEKYFNEALQTAQAGIKDSLASKAGPSTSTKTVTKDRETYRVTAGARVNMSEAINLALSGHLRISMCPVLGKGDAGRLLSASKIFQSEIKTENIGKDPFVITKFLMSIGMKPSEYEQVLELDKYLEIMKKIEDVELDGPIAAVQTQFQQGAEEEIDVKGKGKAKEVVAPTPANISSAATATTTATATSYPRPPPPGQRSRHTVPPWALSLTPAQIQLISHNDVDRWILLRGLLFAARDFLSLAATSLPSVTFDRLVHTGTAVLSAPDLPPHKYAYARTVVLTTVMAEMYDKYAAEKARKMKKAKGGKVEVRDYVVETITPLNKKYETLDQMVVWARSQVGKEYREREAMVLAGDGNVVAGKEEAVEMAERVVSGGGEDVDGLVEEGAAGVMRFLAMWPQLEGVVVEGRKYGG